MIQHAPAHFDSASEAHSLSDLSLAELKQIAKALGVTGRRKAVIIQRILDVNFVRLPAGAIPRVQQPSVGAPTGSAAPAGPVTGAPAAPAGPAVSTAQLLRLLKLAPHRFLAVLHPPVHLHCAHPSSLRVASL